MINNKTPYTIEQDGEGLTVKKDGKVEAKGLLTEDDALHAIWCIENKNVNHFYAVNDGVVVCVHRDEL